MHCLTLRQDVIFKFMKLRTEFWITFSNKMPSPKRKITFVTLKKKKSPGQSLKKNIKLGRRLGVLHSGQKSFPCKNRRDYVPVRNPLND